MILIPEWTEYSKLQLKRYFYNDKFIYIRFINALADEDGWLVQFFAPDYFGIQEKAKRRADDAIDMQRRLVQIHIDSSMRFSGLYVHEAEDRELDKLQYVYEGMVDARNAGDYWDMWEVQRRLEREYTLKQKEEVCQIISQKPIIEAKKNMTILEKIIIKLKQII